MPSHRWVPMQCTDRLIASGVKGDDEIEDDAGKSAQYLGYQPRQHRGVTQPCPDEDERLSTTVIARTIWFEKVRVDAVGQHPDLCRIEDIRELITDVVAKDSDCRKSGK